MRKYSLIRSAFVMGTSLFLLNACGMIKDMEEMHDFTKKVSENSDGLRADSEKLTKTTDFTYKDLRQGNSVNTRREMIKRMLDPNSEDRLPNAATYVMAFEFQLWKSAGTDTQKRRVGFYREALEEFFRDVYAFKNQARKEDSIWDVLEYFDTQKKIDVTSDNPGIQNLSALAAAMYKVNPNQEVQDQEKGSASVSILSLLKDGLKKTFEAKKSDQDSMSIAQAEVAANQEDAVYMLQLRSNFLALVTLAQITPLEDYGWFKKTLMTLSSWEAESIGQKNLTQVKVITRYLREANDTRDFLRSQEYPFEVHWKIAHLYQHLDLSALNQFATPSKTRTSAVEGLKAEIERFKAGI